MPMRYCSTELSKREHGSLNRGFSLRTGGQTMLYLSLVVLFIVYSSIVISFFCPCIMFYEGIERKF